MTFIKSFRKRTILVLFLFFVSCSKPENEWKLTKDQSAFWNTRSAKLTLPPKSKFSQIEPEIITGQFGRKMYFNTHSLPFPHNSEGFTKAKIDNHELYLYQFEGGQRLLVPREEADWIIDQLLSGNAIHVQIGRCNTMIEPGDFKKKYSSLN